MHPYLIIPLLQTVLCAATIPFVAFGRFRGHSRGLFILYLAGLSVMGVMAYFMRSSADVASAFMWSKWMTALTPIQAIIFCHFSIRYDEHHINKWVIPALYGVAAVIGSLAFFDIVVSGVEQVAHGNDPVPGTMFSFVAGVSGFIIVAALIHLFRGARRAVISRERTRDLYIFSALVFLNAGTIFDFMTLRDIPVYAGAIVCGIIFYVLIVIAGLKYRLIEFQTLFRKGLTHLIVALVVSLVYGLAMYFAYSLFGGDLPIWVHGIFLIVLVVTLRLIWDKVQALVDRWFYRERYQFLKELDKFVLDTHDISDYKDIGVSLVDLVRRALNAKCVILMMVSDENELETVATTRDKGEHFAFHEDSPILHWLKTHRAVLTVRSIDVIPQLLPVSESEKHALQEQELAMFVPLKAKLDQVTGLILVGNKVSGGMYSEEEQVLMMHVAERIAIEMENARLYQVEKLIKDELQVQDEKRTEFLHSIAHELKTPLTALLSSAELLEVDIDVITPGQRDRIINNIQRSAGAMDRRVNELLDFARSQTGSLQLKMNPSKINTVLSEAVDRMTPVFVDRQQSLNMDIPDSLPMVNADTDKLDQVIVNLLSNASKYSVSNCEILLKAEHRDGNVVVSVYDCAGQINPEEREKIFEPYYRGQGENNKNLPGLGLGLAIARQIIELHEGRIWVESNPVKGNVFSFSLPVIE